MSLMTLDLAATPIDLLQSMADLVLHPVLVVNQQLRVVVWNLAAERELRFSRAEMIGSHCISGIRCRDCMDGCPILGGQPHGAVTLHRKDGSAARYQRSGRVLEGRDGPALVLEVLEPLAERTEGQLRSFHGLSSAAPAMLKLFDQVRVVARAPVHVLVLGETGTGKRAMVDAIRAEAGLSGPHLRVPCDARAPVDWPAVLAQANGGVLVLEHVDALPQAAQRELAMHWPDEGTTRVVATARPGLCEAVARGEYDAGLYYRLRGVTLTLPGLRDRLEDAPLLAEAWLAERTLRGPRRVLGFTEAAERAMRAYGWPGNLRELRNAVLHAYAVGTGSRIDLDDLPEQIRLHRPTPSLTGSDDDDLRERIRWALARSGGHVGRAADLLGTSRSSFWRLRRRLGV